MTGDTGGARAPLRPASRVTLDDVARHAGVSAATASRALGDGPHVAAATRERVRAAAEELDYVASPEATRLAGGPTGRVAVLVPHPSRWFFGELLEGLEGELRAADLDLVLFRVGGPEERAAFFARLPARRKVDAVVVLTPVDETEHVRLASLDVAVVAAGGRVAPYPSIAVDEHAAGRQAMDHLLHLGHRRIGMIDVEDAGRPDGRRAAWEAALRDAGVEPDGDLVVTVPADGEGGADGMARLLGLRSPPTAVFAHSDEIALGAVRTLRRAGLRVPEDLSVIGIDDHPLAALTDLTTVAQPVREQGPAGRRARAGRPARRARPAGRDAADPPGAPQHHLTPGGPAVTAPDLRLRAPSPGLLALPWERRLGEWDAATVPLRELPVGPSRHLVRFVEADGTLWALKELPPRIARREFDVLRHLEDECLPAVRPAGLVTQPDHDVAILLTRYLDGVLAVPAPHRAAAPEPARAPRAPLRRDGRPARRAAPPRRLLGRLLAGQHAVHPRRPALRRPARRRRDQRGAPVALRRAAGAGPGDPRRERGVRDGRPRGEPGRPPEIEDELIDEAMASPSATRRCGTRCTRCRSSRSATATGSRARCASSTTSATSSTR